MTLLGGLAKPKSRLSVVPLRYTVSLVVSRAHKELQVLVVWVELQATSEALDRLYILLLTLEDPTLLAPLLRFCSCDQVLHSALRKRCRSNARKG